MKTKPFWQSSTLWINVVGIIAVFLTLILDLKIINDVEVVALIVALLNILNRFRPVDKKELTL
jgi:hypothetical protein